VRSQINLIKGDKVSPETDYRDALPKNMYGVLRPMFGAAGYMLQHEGLREYGTGVGKDRGGVWNERLNNHFRVSAGQFLVVRENGSNQRYGLIPGTEQVAMPYSFNTQAIIAGGNFYLFDFDSGFRQVTDSDVGNPIDGVWVDGYYFLTDGEFLYHTDINNEEAISPNKFATSEFSPDPTLGVGKTSDNKAIAFNRYTTEYFANQATENFAFQRIQSRAVKIGIVATHAKCELNDKWYLLGGRKEGALGVHVLGVGSSKQVSTRSIDKIIGEYDEAELADVRLEARSQDGMSFVYVHLPDQTLMFNETLAASAGIDQAWSVITGGDSIRPWRGINGLYEPRLGEWVYGDKEDLRIGILDESVVTQYGELAEWELYTPFMYLDKQSVDELEIETLPGHTAEPGATVFISLTYDGITYGKEWTLNYGQPYEYRTQFIIRRLGIIRNWVGVKLRGITESRMAFSRGFIEHG
jgi:hypothetical protein